MPPGCTAPFLWWLPTTATGHQIALHSASHEYSDIYRSSEAYWADIALLKERIAPYVDAKSVRYLRFPGGSTNTVSRRYGGKGLMKQLKAEVEQKGWQWVDWNVCAEDAVGGHPSADTIYRNVVRETGEQTHCIVLMHDSSTTRTTAEALPDIIRWYADNGYTFLTVAEALRSSFYRRGGSPVSSCSGCTASQQISSRYLPGLR